MNPDHFPIHVVLPHFFDPHIHHITGCGKREKDYPIVHAGNGFAFCTGGKHSDLLKNREFFFSICHGEGKGRKNWGVRGAECRAQSVE
jgi:hypothetical protein